MYSDRRGRGGRDGGFGGGGFGRRDGGGGGGGGGYGDQYGQRWDRNSGGGGGSASSEMLVDQRHVGRIIGKGGSKIRELQDTSGANIKVNSREVEDGKVRIVLSGSDESCQHAEELIRDITAFFNDAGSYGGDRGGGRGGGGGGWRREDGGSYEGGGRRTCYKCGGEGHFARDCTSADSYQQGQRKSSTCYRCGEEGHMARDCQGGY